MHDWRRYLQRDNAVIWICPACGFDKVRNPVFPVHCRCGVYVQADGSYQSRGLGDTIAKVTSAVGIKPCRGCNERIEKLNKLVPYKQ